MLFILNKSEKVVGILNNKGDKRKISPYFNDVYIQDLSTGAETLEFETLANTPEAYNLEVGNFVAFKYKKDFKLFQIMEVTETHDDQLLKSVYCELVALELLNKVVRPVNIPSANIKQLLDNILADTSWTLGMLDLGIVDTHTVEITDYPSIYSVLQEFAVGKFGAELGFRVKIENNRIVAKFIDVYAHRGRDTRHRFEYGENMAKVVKKVDATELATALVGIGKGDITFKSVQADDKPKNQDFIGDQEAYERFNNKGSHLMGTYKADTESPEELLKLTRIELQRRKNPKISYEVDVELLGDDVELGDDVYVIDNEFNPPLYLTARVSQIEGSIDEDGDRKIKLANYKEVRSNITDDMRAIASELEGVVDDKISSKFPVGTDQIQDGAVTGDKVQDNTIHGTHIIADQISVNHLMANSVNAEKIQANSITGEKIQGQEIDGHHIKGDSIEGVHIKAETLEGSHIKGETIEGTHLQALTIEGKHIKAETIVGENIKGDTIEGKHILADQINATHIITDAITSKHISAQSIETEMIKADQIVGSHIKADTIEGSHIKADTITGDNILGNTITGDKISGNTITGDKIVGSSITGDHIVGNTIEGSHIKGETITGDKIFGNTIEGSHIKADTITGSNIKVDTIEGTHIKGATITGDKISGNTIEGSHIKGGTITGDKIFGNTIEGSHIKGDTIEGTHLKGDSITGDKIVGSSITGDKIVGGSITGDKIHGETITADHLVGRTITADKIATGTITADSGIIAEGAIGNAMIGSIDAVKIKSGTIDTSKVTVSGANSNLKLSGNRLQVFHGIGAEQKERVSLGDVNGDGTIYGLRLRGSDGQTVLFDPETGITREGITDGSINNDKISGDANIDGAKLNINSVVTSINGATEKIEGTSIVVDGNNLGITLSEIMTTQTEQGETLEQNKTDIKANADSIKLTAEGLKTAEGEIEYAKSEINLAKESIELKVNKDGVISAIEMSEEEIQISAEKINLNGKVTISDFHPSMDGIFSEITDGEMSKTVIDGSSIKTGLVEAKYINTKGLVVKNDDEVTTFEIHTDGNVDLSGSMQSLNYNADNKTGWKIDKDGNAELNSAIVRGSVILPQSGITDEGTGKDAVRFWAGSDIKEQAPFIVYHDGSVKATRGTFDGTFTGNLEVGNIFISDTEKTQGSILIKNNDNTEDIIHIGEDEVHFVPSLTVGTKSGSRFSINPTTKQGIIKDVSVEISSDSNTINKVVFPNGANNSAIEISDKFKIKNSGNNGLEFNSTATGLTDFTFSGDKAQDVNVKIDGTLDVTKDLYVGEVIIQRSKPEEQNRGIDFIFV